jgi:inorganic phosphate transporter, PiT family
VVNYILAIVAVAFLFDFSNGFHDSANSIATVVGTRVLRPLQAVVWAAFFNFAAAFIVGTAVAKAVFTGFVPPAIVDPNVILAGLLGAIAWNIVTWSVGLPSSSSHALIGAYAGAAVAKAGLGGLVLANGKWPTTLLFIVLSPVIGAALGFTLMTAVYWIFQRVPPARVDRFFRGAQLVSSALFSLSHGANDAQKTMGIIVGLLVASKSVFAGQTGWMHHLYLENGKTIPPWVEMGAYTAISLGTLMGGWRIVHTMGNRITRLRPVGGFCAETGGALSILFATTLGIPVSTTHAITGAIVGVGATTRISAVRWGVATRIVWAWVLTIPAAAAVAAVCWIVLHAVHPL